MPLRSFDSCTATSTRIPNTVMPGVRGASPLSASFVKSTAPIDDPVRGRHNKKRAYRVGCQRVSHKAKSFRSWPDIVFGGLGSGSVVSVYSSYTNR